MRKRLVPLLRARGNLLVVCWLGIGIQPLLHRLLPGPAAWPLSAAVLLALYVAGARWIEGRRAVELRADDSARGIGVGLVSGIGLFSSVMRILWLAGVYRPAGWGNWQPLALALLSALASAVFEEVIFRGFLFRLAAGLGGNWTALGVTSALFGLAHIANPGATWASALAVAIEAGILLGAAYAASGSLWLPIGIHAGWNFAEGPVFGMAVSPSCRQPRSVLCHGVIRAAVAFQRGLLAAQPLPTLDHHVGILGIEFQPVTDPLRHFRRRKCGAAAQKRLIY